MITNECLIISVSVYMQGKKYCTETTYELLGTTDDKQFRIIDIIEVTTIGRAEPEYRYQQRRMSLPDGKYINNLVWNTDKPEKHKQMAENWMKLPYKQVYKNKQSETRFF